MGYVAVLFYRVYGYVVRGTESCHKGDTCRKGYHGYEPVNDGRYRKARDDYKQYRKVKNCPLILPKLLAAGLHTAEICKRSDEKKVEKMVLDLKMGRHGYTGYGRAQSDLHDRRRYCREKVGYHIRQHYREHDDQHND